MKINIVGGGPAGLYFAILMKKRDPSFEITLWERSSAATTWGWGVVFSAKTLGHLESSEPVTHARLLERLSMWTDVQVLLRAESVRIDGNPFAGIARIEILQILQQRCIELGVVLKFEANVEDPRCLADCDLLVGADGIRSQVRETYAAEFLPSLEVGTNKFIWLGTRHRFHGLTMGFADSDAGPFAIHAYRFNQDTSTFIAECSEPTWRQAGLDQMSIDEGLEFLARVFERELGGHSLMSNHSSWINFVRVKNKHWHHGNVVLLGDALHTAHFSIGSGTKLALEDAIVLSQSMESCADEVAVALPHFEKARRPAVEKLQAAAAESRRWFESFGDHMNQDRYLFAYDVMTRSKRVSYENLQRQDARFIAQYDHARAAN